MIPVYIQPPNKPKAAIRMGWVEDKYTDSAMAKAVATVVGIPHADFISGRYSRKLNRWTLVTITPLGNQDEVDELVGRLAAMPLSTENLKSTWCPPEWEEIKDWWDEFVREARKLKGGPDA